MMQASGESGWVSAGERAGCVIFLVFGCEVDGAAGDGWGWGLV